MKSWPQAVASVLTFALAVLKSAYAAPTDTPSAASFYVPSLPDIEQDPERPLTIFAGHILSDPNASRASSTDVTSHLFFFLVRNRRAGDRPRILFWFNGGPGCSSFDGLMMEIGPWRMNQDGRTFSVVEGGWEEFMTVVYVDQPAGTGFSYTSTDHYVHTLDEAAAQFVTFLGNFYAVFPEYRNIDTYLGGESFAGQYIPSFANAILNSNLRVPLRGAAIGNGWIDARRQYPSYLDFAVRIGELEQNSEAWKAAKARTDECQAALDAITDHEPVKVNKCEGLLMDVMAIREKNVNGKDMCINIYDIRLDDVAPACGMNWPPMIHNVTKYLDRQDVVHAIHADGKPGSWVECQGRVSQEFRGDLVDSAIGILPKVLEKIPVLLFVGDQDYICNYVGMEAMMQAMTWNGEKGLGTVQTQTWTVDGSPAGTWVNSRNLTYAKIFNASHMAPFDSPHIAHDMILRFVGFNFSAILDGSARIPSSIGGETKPVFIGGTEPVPTNSASVGKTPEQDKAMWEAYYNAGSAALVLIILLLIIGLIVWYRMRKRGLKLPADDERNAEESIPLTTALRHKDQDGNGFGSRKGYDDDGPDEETSALKSRSTTTVNTLVGSAKGKGKAVDPPASSSTANRGQLKEPEPEPEPEPLFDVGDSDEEEEDDGDEEEEEEVEQKPGSQQYRPAGTKLHQS